MEPDSEQKLAEALAGFLDGVRFDAQRIDVVLLAHPIIQVVQGRSVSSHWD